MEVLHVALIAVALIAIPLYFQSRLASPPTQAERWVAMAWLWFRRAVCFLAFAFFFAFAALLTYGAAIGRAPFSALLGVPVLIGFAWMSAHWGVYGAGYRRYDFSEDKPIHHRRKKRYGWRW